MYIYIYYTYLLFSKFHLKCKFTEDALLRAASKKDVCPHERENSREQRNNLGAAGTDASTDPRARPSERTRARRHGARCAAAPSHASAESSQLVARRA